MSICKVCGNNCGVINRILCSDECIIKYSKIDENGCWLWKGSITYWGYGQINRNGKVLLVHIISWKHCFGEIEKGLCVCHKCDVRTCVNPNHLFLGTRKQNNEDRIRKGRSSPVRGEKSHKAKLTEDKVREIRKLYAEGLSMKKLGKIYNVSNQAIDAVVKKRNWKHVGDL